jgi:hypothetical protein
VVLTFISSTAYYEWIDYLGDKYGALSGIQMMVEFVNFLP